jgi:hypothetical protein
LAGRSGLRIITVLERPAERHLRPTSLFGFMHSSLPNPLEQTVFTGRLVPSGLDISPRDLPCFDVCRLPLPVGTRRNRRPGRLHTPI